MALVPQDKSTAAGHRPGGGQRDLGVGHLARSGGASQLLDGLDYVVEAVDIGLRQQASMRVQRQLAVAVYAPVLHKGATFAFLAKAQPLQLHDHAVGEAIVNLGDIDVLGSDARAAPQVVGNVLGVVVGVVGPANRVEQVIALVRSPPVGRPHDIDRLV